MWGGGLFFTIWHNLKCFSFFVYLKYFLAPQLEDIFIFLLTRCVGKNVQYKLMKLWVTVLLFLIFSVVKGEGGNLHQTKAAEKSLKVSPNRVQQTKSLFVTLSSHFLQTNCNSSGNSVQRKCEVSEWGEVFNPSNPFHSHGAADSAASSWDYKLLREHLVVRRCKRFSPAEDFLWTNNLTFKSQPYFNIFTIKSHGLMSLVTCWDESEWIQSHLCSWASGWVGKLYTQRGGTTVSRRQRPLLFTDCLKGPHASSLMRQSNLSRRNPLCKQFYVWQRQDF